MIKPMIKPDQGYGTLGVQEAGKMFFFARLGPGQHPRQLHTHRDGRVGNAATEHDGFVHLFLFLILTTRQAHLRSRKR